MKKTSRYLSALVGCMLLVGTASANTGTTSTASVMMSVTCDGIMAFRDDIGHITLQTVEKNLPGCVQSVDSHQQTTVASQSGSSIVPIHSTTKYNLNMFADDATTVDAKNSSHITGAYLVNMRSSSKLTSKVISVLSRNTPVVVLATKGKWKQVQTEDGKIGYVYGAYIAK